jgi:molybdate transport repressor ModE-like protein/molybdopterin-binding protein
MAPLKPDFVGLSGERMTNEYAATVESCDSTNTYVWLKIGRARLAARRWPGIAQGQGLKVRIRPEDVILSRLAPGQISARNVFPGTARGTRRAPEGAYVTLDVGFPLTALITPEAARDLSIRRGTPLFAILKASAVTPSVDIRAKARVSFEGAHGLLDARKMDFLRMVSQSGSLSAAARELGVSYRTAWMWAQAINRRWGSRLIARVHGGPGGGGTAVSPEGRALLERAGKLEESINRDAGKTLATRGNAGSR